MGGQADDEGQALGFAPHAEGHDRQVKLVCTEVIAHFVQFGVTLLDVDVLVGSG